MLKCNICGKEVRHDLCTHIRNSHKLTKSEYLTLFPNSELFSKEILDSRSERIKKRWDDPIQCRKILKSREGIYRTKEWKENQKTGYDEAKKTGKIKDPWNKGKTKETDIRIKNIGEKNRKHLLGRTKETHEYLKHCSDRMKETSIFSSDRNPTLLYDLEEKENWKRKISNTLSTRIANGEVHFPSNRFKCGWYEGKNEKYYYQSNLELDAMIFLDSCDVVKKWTNKHGIKIEYHMPDQSIHFYIPDLYIELECGKCIIVEMKGYENEEVIIKEKYAKDIYKENYFIFYNINDLKETIYELNKN